MLTGKTHECFVISGVVHLKSKALVITARCACAHIQSRFTGTHKSRQCSCFWLLSCCHQRSSLPAPLVAEGTLSRGSFQVLSHSFKCRETSKSPQILNLHLFPSSEGQPPEHHLTHCRIRPDLNRNPALVSWQVSMPLSSANVRQLLESTRLALWAFHRKETRVWWPSACKPNSFGKHLDA